MSSRSAFGSNARMTQCSRIDLYCQKINYVTYHPRQTCPKSMAWLPTQADQFVILAWCTLTGEIGKPLLAFVGFGGLIGTAKSLWTLPTAADSGIITVRNKQRRYRRNTIIVGWFAFLFFAISIVLYFHSTSLLRGLGPVCEMALAPHTAATAVLPFLLITITAVTLFIWLQVRSLNLKNR